MRIKTIKINWSYPILYVNIFSFNKTNEKGIYYLSRKFGYKGLLPPVISMQNQI